MRRTFTKKPVLASTTSDVVKFEVGQTYTCSGLYGGQIKYTVVDRTNNSVALEESHVSEDDWSDVNDGVKEYPIVIQNMYDDGYENVIGKQESVVIWEYSGHEGYLYATNPTASQVDDAEEEEGDEPSATKGLPTTQVINETEQKVILDLCDELGVVIDSHYSQIAEDTEQGIRFNTFYLKYSDMTPDEDIQALSEYFDELDVGYNIGYHIDKDTCTIELYHYL